jgi:hypothetical protein
MNSEQTEISELIQRQAVALLATHPAGEGLCLIGGFRYRLLDRSCRRSLDLDYHWPGDLEQKQAEIVALLRKKLLPLLRARMALDGSVSPATGPDADSPAVRTVEVAAWKKESSLGRITIPVDITRIPCADKPVARTVDGVVYLSASDADMVESKVLALFLRPHLQERDLVDVFLFQDKFREDSAKRIEKKLSRLSVPRESVSALLTRLSKESAYHARNIEAIVRDQVDPSAAANIRAAGGGGMVFDQVMELLWRRLGLGTER